MKRISLYNIFKVSLTTTVNMAKAVGAEGTYIVIILPSGVTDLIVTIG